MTTIQKLLNQLVDAYRSIEFDFNEILNDGLCPDAIAQLESHLPFKLPSDVREMYEWRNGVTIGMKCTDGFLWDYAFLDFEAAVKNYLYLSERKAFDPRTNEHLWFPIFQNVGGDTYSVDCSSEGTHGAIWRTSTSGSEAVIRYASLADMIVTIIKCVEGGAYYFADGYWEADLGLQKAISRKYNPDIASWQRGA